MTDLNLERLQSDLSTIRHAGKFDKPYASEDIPILLYASVTGLVMSAITLSIPPASGWVVLVFVPLAIIYVRYARRRRRDRAARPGLWREIRMSLMVAAVMTPLMLLWIRWEQSLGISREFIGAGALFFIGVGHLIVGLLDPSRRSYLAPGLALMVYGIVIPLCTPDEVVVAGGLTTFAAMLGAAAVTWWQLRRDSATA